ncbi:MAG: DNA repair protein RadC [Alphaproteobacteria bacterium]
MAAPRNLNDQKDHRTRLRERFAADDGASMPDYELLELILFSAIPRRDTKPLAKRLIERFGSLAGVLAADRGDIVQVEGAGPGVAGLLKSVHQAGIRQAREDLHERQILDSWDKVLEYCRAAIGHLPRESFHVLFLDRKNGLIAAEQQSAGTVDQTSVYPREVIKRALELNACALVMVHNHPSGDPTPSDADIEITRAVAAVCESLGVALHDHVIIARGGHASLREKGLF